MSIPDVSLKLEHIRHYLVLADEQCEKLHGCIQGSKSHDIANRMGWLIDDALKMLAEAKETLYPDGKLATHTTQGK